MSDDKLRADFAVQADFCLRLGSPFTGRVCALLGERLDRSSAIGRAVSDWPDPPGAARAAVPLRLAGGLHALARSGSSPDLAAVYPPHDANDGMLRRRVASALTTHADTLLAWLGSAPQTNEVRRSSLIMAGLAVIAHEVALPMRLLELGSSAGLNLLPDRYAHRLGGREYGEGNAAVRLQPGWTGDPPPPSRPHIVDRRGVDLNPLDVTCAGDCERLLAFIWADQTERLERTVAALAIARRDPPRVDAGEAADWLEARLAETTEDGIATVVMHTIAFQYFGADSQARIARRLDDAGARAIARAPLAWLRFELPAGPESSFA